MDATRIATGYLAWHYGRALRDIFNVWKNLLWFVAHFFSIGLLLRTLLSPWKRIVESHPRGTGMEDYFATIVVNIMSRIVGAFVRLWVVASGLLALVSTAGSIIPFYCAWLAAPVLILGALVRGVALIF